MSIVKVDCKRIQGVVEPPYSKSYLHRFLICSYLFGAMNRAQDIIRARIPEDQLSDDIRATWDCLLALDEGRCLDCRESGTTLRMLLPITAAMDGEFVLHRGPSLATRPIQPLIDELNRHGACITENGPDVVVRGRLESGDYTVPGNISSQFISGLLFAFVLLNDGCHITVEGDVESRPYIDMTVNAIHWFTVWDNDDCEYYELLTEILECDWSAAAIWYVADYLTGGSIQITGMNSESVQGDKEIVPMLGVIAEASNTENKARAFDLSDFPDIAPFVALAAVKSACRLKIVNIGRLRLKECDRLRATFEILTQLGADVTAGEDWIEINGKQVSSIENKSDVACCIGSQMQNGNETGEAGYLLPGSDEPVETYGDHRMVMLAAIASIICEKQVIIKDAETVAKSYPTFFDETRRLGGIIHQM